METKKIICPKCSLQMEYRTKNNYIQCTKCNESIEVEPNIKTITLDDLLEKQIIFVEERWTEEDGDYWWEYYEDEDCTIEIEDIDEYVRKYNEVR